jgi:hypothetical protein
VVGLDTVLVEGDHRAVTVELLVQCDVVGVQRADGGGGGVDLFTESVALGGHRCEPASKFGQLFVAACLAGRAGVGGGQSTVPLGQNVGCAVHGGPADLGLFPEVVLDEPAVGALWSAGQKPLHRVA